VNAQIFNIRQVREDNRQVAIDNAWNEYLAKVKAATEATRQMNEAHDRWMSFCRRAP
jgi:hypothetical protein